MSQASAVALGAANVSLLAPIVSGALGGAYFCGIKTLECCSLGQIINVLFEVNG